MSAGASEPATRIRGELLEPLRRTLAWLASHADSEGRLVCPDHGIEHTGKSACAAILALELARHDPERRDAHVAFAAGQGRRLVANLVREGTSPCHTFWPGRHDPYNSSNAVIDGGACSDALASLVLELGDELAQDDREAFTEASVLHARTYLRYAVLDKGIPAQRAWGLTGLAAAAALAADPQLEAAAMEAVGILEGVQHADGSFSYHPIEWGAEHPGAADVSAFYQSRVTAFTLHALERLGRDPTEGLFAGPLLRGLDFVLALQGVDGIKCGLVEAKPWYWGAPYEVASHPFDVYALARGGALFRRPRLSAAALAAHRAWADHLAGDGRPTSHRAGPATGRSYQCPFFWASHAAWSARALPELEREAAREVRPLGAGDGIDLGVGHFPDADLARLEDDRVIAWIRGARPEANVHHGSPHGGLLRVQRKSDGAELVRRVRWAAGQEAEWSGSRGAPRPRAGLASGAREVRFAAWLARNHWRGGRTASALAAPWDAVRRGVLDFAAPAVSSAFDRGPALEVRRDGAVLSGGVAWRDGAPVPGVRLERRFEIDGAGLTVHETLSAEGRAGRGLVYRVPAAATDVRRDPDGTRVSYRLT